MTSKQGPSTNSPSDRDPDEEGSAAKQPQRSNRRDQDPDEEGSAARPQR